MIMHNLTAGMWDALLREILTCLLFYVRRDDVPRHNFALYYSISFNAFLNWNENSIAVKLTAIISATGSAIYTA